MRMSTAMPNISKPTNAESVVPGTSGTSATSTSRPKNGNGSSSGGMQFSLDFTQKLPPAAQERIQQGMTQAETNADPTWKTVIIGCIVTVARRRKELTVDDVLDEIETMPENVRPSTHNLAALGPLMKRCAKDGVISHTDRVQRSSREKKHGNRHNVWISNIYEGMKQ